MLSTTLSISKAQGHHILCFGSVRFKVQRRHTGEIPVFRRWIAYGPKRH